MCTSASSTFHIKTSHPLTTKILNLSKSIQTNKLRKNLTNSIELSRTPESGRHYETTLRVGRHYSDTFQVKYIPQVTLRGLRDAVRRCNTSYIACLTTHGEDIAEISRSVRVLGKGKGIFVVFKQLQFFVFIAEMLCFSFMVYQCRLYCVFSSYFAVCLF